MKLGHPAPTGYDDQRAEAQEQITRRLRQAGINLSMVSRPTDLYQAELCLALALLFESTQQFARDGQGDLYAQQGKFWRAAYEDAFAQAAPIQNVRSEGAGFEFGRG